MQFLQATSSTILHVHTQVLIQNTVASDLGDKEAPRSNVSLLKRGHYYTIMLLTFNLYFLCSMQFKKPKLLQFRPLVTITILGCAEQLQSCYYSYTLQQVLRLPIWCHKGINVKKKGGCIHYISRARCEPISDVTITSLLAT